MVDPVEFFNYNVSDPAIKAFLQEHDSSQYKLFSGADITAFVSLPGVQSYRLGTLSLMSISMHRDKFPVTSLGRINAKGFTYGHRTIGGTLVFSTLDRSVWFDLMKHRNDKRQNRFPLDLYRGYPDDLPPMDVSITFVNEYGAVAYTAVGGMTVLDQGETYAIEQPEVMETYSYMALTRIPMQGLA